MDFGTVWPYLIVIALTVITGVASGFFSAAGGHLWSLVHKRIDPPPPPPPERYFVTQSQFKRWKGELAKLYEARRAEGYEFACQIEGRVSAYENDGWEKMFLDDKEIWTDSAGVPCAFLMRKR